MHTNTCKLQHTQCYESTTYQPELQKSGRYHCPINAHNASCSTRALILHSISQHLPHRTSPTFLQGQTSANEIPASTNQGSLGEWNPCTNPSINQESPTEERKISADLGLRSRSNPPMIRGKDNDDEGAAAAETAHSPATSPRARRAPPPSPPVALGVSNPLPLSSVGLWRWKQPWETVTEERLLSER